MKRSALALTLTLAIMFLAVAGTLFIKTVMAKTITVPDDYPIIQAAIDNASQGDTVFVKSGTYYETLVINKPISLIGENRNTTIIDANYVIANIIDIRTSSVTIAGFTIENCSGYNAPVFPQPDGILIESSSNCNITGNTITGILHGNGISLRLSLNSSSFVWSSDNTIAGNYITNCGASGIFISGGGDNTIRDNSIINNFAGASIEDESHNNTIIGNYFANSTYNYGLELNRCSNNTVVSNTFAYNQFGLAVAPSANNIFYHNNFVDNENQVLLYGTKDNWVGLVNYWNSGKEGNYWSDYLTRYPNATEIDNSGIGDMPYSLVANADNSVIYQDRYPLIKEFIIPEFPTLIILAQVMIATLLIALVFLKKRSHARINKHSEIEQPSTRFLSNL